MAHVTAVGPGPVTFTDAEGKLIEVPLSEIVFDDDGQASTNGPHASTVGLAEWLAYLATTGRISPGTGPPTIALEFIASSPGARGNGISVTTSTVQPATTPRKADITVELTDRYTDLTADGLLHLDDLLGTSAKDGSKPGVLRVADPMPADLTLPAVGDKLGAGNPVTWTIATGTGTNKLVLEPADPGSDFGNGKTTVSIEPGTAPQSVTLVITWSAKAANVKDGDSINALDSFAFLVTVGGDPAPTKVTLPLDGTVALSGGTEPVDARPAKASLLAMD
jgi:hypothetical protein